MRLDAGNVVLSATDLANHLSCECLTSLDFRLVRGEVAEPKWENPHLVVLRQRGLEHEKKYLESLRARGLSILEVPAQREATLAGMQAGVDVIYQGNLASEGWGGRTDVLLRVDHPDRTSRWGNWSYEVVDCKLACETKAETVMQLCLYSDLLSLAQGMEPEQFHVIRPNLDFKAESFRFASYAAYYRAVKKALELAMQSGGAEVYPDPVEHCEICRWWKVCDRRRRADDHLSFVAGASKLQRKELGAHEISTMRTLAAMPLPMLFRPGRGAVKGYERIREQARVQHEARSEGKLKYEFLALEEGKGLAALPEPCAGDIFLDFEGDPFVEDGGREYLFGVVTREETGGLGYFSRWALDRTQERAAFEWLIDFAMERILVYPGARIYHFGAYEPSAVKRMMLRYATREEEVDQLLRGERFVDLHCVAKQGVRASVEQYSLKDLEKFCGFERTVPLAEASHARHFVENQLEMNAALEPTDGACLQVERYNQDDCLATERLRHWLEGLRASLISQGMEIQRPVAKPAEATEKTSAVLQRIAVLFEALTRGISEEPGERTAEQSAQWLLAHALNWHGREDKVKWWEFFRMKSIPEEDLFDHRNALIGLFSERKLPKKPRDQNFSYEYQFPDQECSIKAGDDLFTLDEEPFGKVVAIDAIARTIVIRKAKKAEGCTPAAVFEHRHFGGDEQRNAILRLADWVVANGIDAEGEHRAARDLLLRKTPRLANNQSLALADGEDVVSAACRIALALDGGVLPIQGPPGTGKTFTGARMICELVRSCKKVGVTAVGHKVIHKLLEEVCAAAKTRNLRVDCGHKDKGEYPSHDSIVMLDPNERAEKALQSGEVHVLGGTQYLWAREEFKGAVDVLFVDEAGQMSLANVLACAQAAKSIVLLGDPQQLEQPQKGSHPEGSDISALGHLVGDSMTISSDQGLFLGMTRRMHPAICRLTSELFYDSRLSALPGLERQRLEVSGEFAGAGLWFVPVSHDSNQSYSLEEVEQVAAIVEYLVQPDHRWIDYRGESHALSLKDVLIVAPYNDQVNRLKARVPGGNIGTVDKFQGQEAAVVIYSLATSSAEDAPRGMEFLYDLNRLNVATSRARCGCILVGSRALFSPDCHTPRQMELANVLCRYAELSTEVPFGTRVLTAT